VKLTLKGWILVIVTWVAFFAYQEYRFSQIEGHARRQDILVEALAEAAVLRYDTKQKMWKEADQCLGSIDERIRKLNYRVKKLEMLPPR
jgi:hypothetical protein